MCDNCKNSDERQLMARRLRDAIEGLVDNKRKEVKPLVEEADPFARKPFGSDDRKGLVFDVDIDVAWDWKADRAPSPMDEVEMVRARIEAALRSEFPNGAYKVTVTDCDC